MEQEENKYEIRINKRKNFKSGWTEYALTGNPPPVAVSPNRATATTLPRMERVKVTYNRPFPQRQKKR